MDSSGSALMASDETASLPRMAGERTTAITPPAALRRWICSRVRCAPAMAGRGGGGGSSQSPSSKVKAPTSSGSPTNRKGGAGRAGGPVGGAEIGGGGRRARPSPGGPGVGAGGGGRDADRPREGFGAPAGPARVPSRSLVGTRGPPRPGRGVAEGGRSQDEWPRVRSTDGARGAARAGTAGDGALVAWRGGSGPRARVVRPPLRGSARWAAAAPAGALPRPAGLLLGAVRPPLPRSAWPRPAALRS